MFFARLLGLPRRASPAAAATTDELRAVLEEASGRGPRLVLRAVGVRREPPAACTTAGSRPTVRPCSSTVHQVQTNAGLFRMPMDVRITTAPAPRTTRVESGRGRAGHRHPAVGARQPRWSSTPTTGSSVRASGADDPTSTSARGSPDAFYAGVGLHRAR